MSRIDKRIVFAAMIAAATLLQAGLAGAAFLGRQQFGEELAAAKERTASYAFQAERAKAQAVPTEAAKQSPWRLLDGPDVTGTMQVIQALGDATGITFGTVKASQSNTAGKQSFQITGRGSPAQVCAFLVGIEKSPRLIVIENGRASPGGQASVAFELGLATFHGVGGK